MPIRPFAPVEHPVFAKGFLMASDADLTNEFFQVRRHGDIAVIVPSPQIEHLPETLLQPAAQMVLAPLKEDPPSQIIVDLSEVNYFGSAFITFLLRCHEIVKPRGSELSLAGVNKQIRELLRTTNLDTLWALYDNANEAIAALGGVD
jgi:anti-sigma B factor antagonist